jgi:hypothetical protein
MTTRFYTDPVITPATWPTQKDSLATTPSGLLNMVGWFGSTHASAMWRKAPEFLQVFQNNAVPGFDPQIDSWDPSYSAIEAEVMAKVSVIIIRLENHELLNGSLGSIAEIGLALTSAALRGQILVVSMEDNLLTTLTESGAIAQFMMLELHLDLLKQDRTLTSFLQLHRGDDLQALAEIACKAAQQQLSTPLASLNFDKFQVKKHKRLQNDPTRVLLAGSGGPYAETQRAVFTAKKNWLRTAYSTEQYRLKVLSEGAIARAWGIPYGSTDQLTVGLALQTLLSIELEYKHEADILLLPIMAEASSKATVTEIGFLLLYALTTGQEVKIFLEPFDPVDYIHHQLKDVITETETNEKGMRRALQQAGVADNILATADQGEVLETFGLIRALARGDSLRFKQVKQSLLGQTEAFHNADNIQRVRALVQAHLERLHKDPKYPDFFSLATCIEG